MVREVRELSRWRRRAGRLIRAGMVPARAGQPTQVLVHLTLAQVRGTPGASAAEDAWAASHADAATYRAWLADAGLEITEQDFLPEGDGGHALFWARRQE
jgi:hypothetical protein